MPAGTRSAWRVRGLVSLSVALTCACAAGPTTGDSPASVPGAGPVATLSPPASPPSADPSAPDVVARMPAAARERTSEGAVAFVRYFMELTNEMKMHPRPGIIAPLSSAACKSCAGLEEVTQDLIAAKEHYRGPAVTIKEVWGFSGDPGRDASYRVGVSVLQGGYPIVSAGGDVVQEVPASDHTFVVHLTWMANGWKADKLKVLKFTGR